MRAFYVYLGKKEIDIVFYNDSEKVTKDDVKKSLVNHDGYHPDIKVVERKEKKKCA